MLTEIESKGASLDFEGESREFLEVVGAFIKELLYDVYLQHQQSIKKNRVRSHFRAKLQLTFLLVQSLQLVSVLLERCSDVSDYAQFKFVEDVLVSMRVDLWAEKMQKVDIAVVVSLAVLATSVTALTLEMVLVRVYPERQLHPLLMLTADLPATIVHRLLLVPILLLYLRCVFDGLLSPQDTEYSALWLGLLSVAGLAGYCGLIVLRVCFLYESAWYQRQQRMLARADHTFELKEAAVYFVISLLISLRKSPEVSILVTGGLCLYLLGNLLLFQPYYHPHTLTAKAVQYATLSWVCLSAEAAVATDTITTGICLVLFVSPCIGMLAAYVQRRRSRFVWNEKSPQSLWQYELALRRLLEKYSDESDEDSDSIKDCLRLGAKVFGDEKMYYLLLAQYYYYERDLPEIALLRLAMTKGCVGGLLIDFQILRLGRALCRHSKSEERDFVDFQSCYMRAKDLDQKLCETTCDILNILINKNTSSGQLERSFIMLAKATLCAKEAYRTLKQKYPYDPFLLEMYGSFIESLFHDRSGADLITRGNFEKTRRKKVNINTIESYSSEDTGVLIISCDPDRFGKITFANEQLAHILRCNVQDVVGKDLDDFIPPPYNYKHNMKLTSFLSAGEAKQIFRRNLFLSSMGRFSVEVTFRFRPTAVGNIPYFVTAVRQKPQNREFAIFDSALKITSHSQNFKKLLNLPETNLAGVELEQALPGITARYSKGKEADPFLYYHPNLPYPLGAMFSKAELGSQVIPWVYIFTQARDIDDLFNAATTEGLSLLKRELQATPAHISEAKAPEASSLHPASVLDFDLRGKDQSVPTTTNLKETKDDGSSTAPALTSFALSPLGSALRRHTLRAVKTYKVSYLVTMLLMAAFISISLAVVYSTFHSLSQGNDVIDLGSSRMHLVKTTHLVRRLNLVKQGWEQVTPDIDLVQRLRSEVELLGEAVEKHLKTNSKSVPVWKLIRDSYEFKIMPLVTALTEFHDDAQLESNSNSGSVYGPNFFFVYRNGLTSLLKALNTTVNDSMSETKSSSFTVIALATSVSFALMAAVLVVSSVFVGRSLWQLRRCYRTLWKCVVSLPVTSITATLQAHKDRLEYIHGDEYQTSDHTRIRGNTGLTQPPNKLLPMLAKAAAFVVLTAGFVLFLLLYGYQQVQTLLDSHTTYLNTKSLTTFMPTLVLTLLKESYLSHTPAPSYANITGPSQVFYSLRSRLSIALSALSYFENNVLADTAAVVELGGSQLSADLSLVLSNACPFVNVSNSVCGESALAKGQHQGMLELRSVARDLSQRFEEGTADWHTVARLEDYLDALSEATEITSEKMRTYTVATSAAFVNSMLLYCCFYVLASAGLYVFLYLPMITRMKRKCLSVWRISTLIRHDLVLPPK